jgi:predicted ATPase
MKAAHGGQILLSQAISDRLRDCLPQSTSLRDLGSMRLRDLATPEHVYQLVHPQLRQDFPALRSLEATPNNLPQQVTSFIGRERELNDAKGLLERTRLLTLLGMGGLGKTRLSLQIAADVLERFRDGVWFVDLAPINDPSLVASAAAQVLGVHEEPGKPLTQTLCAFVRDHKALFILDNCEHLVSACAALANALLRSASGVSVVATSREALHIPGEQTYAVHPLAIPDRKAGIDTLMRSEAVQLFVERAQLQKPEFTLTDRNAPAVAELCSRLEGIPLALELAAARLRSLSIDEVNARLQDRFKLLTGGSRVALERQQTLRALVTWSYDLLLENERLLLERLSIFAGGFDLAAAETVAGVAPLEPDDVLDLLTSLVEKSLVMVEHGDLGSRYGMLETIREFARDRLARQEGLDNAAARHCDYYLSFAKTARPKLRGPEQATWTGRLEAELDNLRAATALALSGKADPVNAVKFVVALMRFFVLRGYSTEGRNIVRAALALPVIAEPSVARAHALYVGGSLATIQGDHVEAKSMLTECLAIRRDLRMPLETAATLSTLTSLYLHLGDPEQARESEQEALGMFRELGDRVGEGVGLLHLGEICVQLGDGEKADEYFEQCLAIAQAIKHQELESECEWHLGDLALDREDLPNAHTRFTRALKICRDAQDKRSEAIALWRLGRVDAASGVRDSARARMAEALLAFKAFEMNSEAVDCLEDYAELLRLDGDVENAVQAYAAVAAIRESRRLYPLRRGRTDSRKSVEAARSEIGQLAFDAAWATGREWTLDKAIDRVLSIASATPFVRRELSDAETNAAKTTPAAIAAGGR